MSQVQRWQNGMKQKRRMAGKAAAKRVKSRYKHMMRCLVLVVGAVTLFSFGLSAWIVLLREGHEGLGALTLGEGWSSGMAYLHSGDVGTTSQQKEAEDQVQEHTVHTIKHEDSWKLASLHARERIVQEIKEKSEENKEHNGEKGKQTTRNRPSSKLTVAILYSGFTRAFQDENVRETHVRHFLMPLRQAGFHIFAFFVGGEGDRQPKRRAKFNTYTTAADIEHWLKDEWHLETRVSLKNPPPYPRNYTRCDGYENTKVHHLDQLDRFWGTWWRVRESYREMKKFEDESGWQFDAVIRVRPDFAFLRRADVSELESAVRQGWGSGKSYFITPPSSFIRQQNMNDWAAACARPSCDEYFEMLTRWENCEDELCCWGWGPFYDKAIASSSVEYDDSFALFPVVLVRKNYVACNRLDTLYLQDYKALQQCYDLSKALALRAEFTCFIDGELVIDESCAEVAANTK